MSENERFYIVFWDDGIARCDVFRTPRALAQALIHRAKHKLWIPKRMELKAGQP